MQLFTYSTLSIIIPAAGIACLLAYAFILWTLGERGRAREYMVMSVMVLFTVIAIGGAYVVANMVVKEIKGENVTIDDLWSTNVLNRTVERYDEIYRKAVEWVIYIANTRATWGLLPGVGYAISESLGAATFWQNWVFSMAATTFLALRWFTLILMYLHPWLLIFGAGLASVPRFKAVGGVLLSIYLVSGATVVLIADSSYDIIFNQYGEYMNVGSTPEWNPTALPTLASRADKAAQGFMWSTMLAIVGTLLMGILTAGTSRVFEGIPVMFRPL